MTDPLENNQTKLVRRALNDALLGYPMIMFKSDFGRASVWTKLANKLFALRHYREYIEQTARLEFIDRVLLGVADESK